MTQVQMGEERILQCTTYDDYRTSIDGKLVAKEIVVLEGSDWGDYVFEKEYDLMPLIRSRIIY